MYRIITDIDLSDPTASLGDKAADVTHVHLVQPIGSTTGLYAIITRKNHEAVLIRRGAMGLDSDDGLKALESFRRWLKMQEIPVQLAHLYFANIETYDEILASRQFTVTCFVTDFSDPGFAARFQEWLGNRPVTTRLSQHLLRG
ncbi:MAG: hypothetical protein H0V44_16660 [Planctomycetes bacterium]|nr:hypothetical protein [Planctomycetota bacterium]